MLETHHHGDILELRLARPPVNALDPALITSLRQAVEAAPKQGARGILLSGQPGMFSAGLDVVTLLRLDRDGMTDFWHEFIGVCSALATSSIPIVAAVTGHSPAGGAVLAIFCDYRVMADGPFKIGLNEVQVGLPVPPKIQAGLHRLVGRYHAERLLVAGAMLDAAQAKTVGFVDELAAPDQVVPRARAWLETLLKLPPHAMSTTRRIARADLAALFANSDHAEHRAFVDDWFADETQTTLKALVARLKSK